MQKKFCVLSALILSLISCSLLSKKENGRSERTVSSVEEYDYLRGIPPVSLTCEDFVKMLHAERPKPRTVQEALEVLKKNNPEYFGLYTLVANSLSLQESSYENPRVLLFGTTSEMVLSFNGSPEQKGYERIEMMCFDRKKATFSFKEMAFPTEAPKTEAISDLTPKEKDLPFVLKSGNQIAPERDCRQCHQTPLRPNWDTYASWPRNFGAMDDVLFRPHEAARIKARGGAYGNSLSYLEAENKAASRFSYTGRYALLENYFDGKDRRPNLRLGKQLSDFNIARIIRELKVLGSRFDKVKKNFVQAFVCPPDQFKHIRIPIGNNGQAVLPKVLKPGFSSREKRLIEQSASYNKSRALIIQKTYQEWTGEKNDPYRDEVSMKIAEYYEGIGFSPEISPFIEGTDLRTVLQMNKVSQILKPLGVEVVNWSMVVNGGFEFEQGDGGANRDSFEEIFMPKFVKVFFPEDKKLQELIFTSYSNESGLEEADAAEKEACRLMSQ